MGVRFLELPDEASSVVPEAAVATVAALGDFATKIQEDGHSFVETSVNPLTQKLICLSISILSCYCVVTWVLSVADHRRNCHERKLKKL